MGIGEERSPIPDEFERLVEEYSDRVYGIALRITGSPTDAQDAMQETFLAAFRGLGSFRGEASVGTWMYRVAVNASLQICRRRPPSDQVLIDSGTDDWSVRTWRDETVDTEAQRRELAEILERGIVLLPDDYRVAVVLRDVEGLSASEAAEILNIGEAALKSRLHRGRVLLRQYLSEYLTES
jgi:RNA polymerase sigma-70 factor, ECF subfamily